MKVNDKTENKTGTEAWDMLIESLDEFSDDYMEERAQPEEQVRKTKY